MATFALRCSSENHTMILMPSIHDPPSTLQSRKTRFAFVPGQCVTPWQRRYESVQEDVRRARYVPREPGARAPRLVQWPLHERSRTSLLLVAREFPRSTTIFLTVDFQCEHHSVYLGCFPAMIVGSRVERQPQHRREQCWTDAGWPAGGVHGGTPQTRVSLRSTQATSCVRVQPSDDERVTWSASSTESRIKGSEYLNRAFCRVRWDAMSGVL